MWCSTPEATLTDRMSPEGFEGSEIAASHRLIASLILPATNEPTGDNLSDQQLVHVSNKSSGEVPWRSCGDSERLDNRDAIGGQTRQILVKTDWVSNTGGTCTV